ncbi:MAG: hypothetical protein JJ892_04660 [Balneola sp.]|nr:hypothetical protein [Balneola sp.]MBO6651284.1 hypothetical protein [Balneola sp.]MBO6710865.1 hypothetical protein [Balneola sp.]MBO6799552.1 hypothetical protein [Balneola sp.]MBO6870284.1 hypothetical protein [Balneola sp.]
MEEQRLLFEQIRTKLIEKEKMVTAGKMMSTEAIKYDGNVFVFISKNGNMVFKFGKTFDPEAQDFESIPFNPFKNKGPLAGWFEVSFSQHELWEFLTQEALTVIKKNK